MANTNSIMTVVAYKSSPGRGWILAILCTLFASNLH